MFYDVFYTFWTALFNETIVSEFEAIFVLISIISVFIFLKMILTLIIRALKVFLPWKIRSLELWI